ncbi:conserved hypothetical protein [Bradyrhizobium sp. STM 3843]|uniref:hypothetical protein n=1 Tax=unclassified Bradyrhizobium TaxID=2631580 RepID=UPI000240AE26|nr:hypothetical protein [Bradyrhizobium sp. STM 3843]CCE05260.1 conserved hypothetical protein [Bradyrhizobium sp. STM 3843]
MRSPFHHTPIGHKGLHDGVLVQMRHALLRTLARFRPAVVSTVAIAAAVDAHVEPSEAAVLAFPVRGEALLVNLASTLRERVMRSDAADDPFLMTMSRSPRPRLSIDRDAYVEFHAEDSTFHLKIDAIPASRLTLETPEFTMLVKFVLQYLAERHGEPDQGGGMA